MPQTGTVPIQVGHIYRAQMQLGRGAGLLFQAITLDARPMGGEPGINKAPTREDGAGWWQVLLSLHPSHALVDIHAIGIPVLGYMSPNQPGLIQPHPAYETEIGWLPSKSTLDYSTLTLYEQVRAFRQGDLNDVKLEDYRQTQLQALGYRGRP